MRSVLSPASETKNRGVGKTKHSPVPQEHHYPVREVPMVLCVHPLIECMTVDNLRRLDATANANAVQWRLSNIPSRGIEPRLAREPSYSSHSSKRSSWIPVEAPNPGYVQHLLSKLLLQAPGDNPTQQERRVRRAYHQVCSLQFPSCPMQAISIGPQHFT